MSSATPSSAAPDGADPASTAPTVGAVGGTLPAAPAVVTAPERHRPTVADVVAAAVVWLGVVLGVAAKLYAAGWFVLVVLALAPVTIALPVAAAWIVTLPLVGLGAVRKRAGRAPRRYRRFAWGIGLGVLVGYAAMYDGGDVGAPRSTLSILLGDSWVVARLGDAAPWLLLAALAASAVAIGWYVVDRVRLGKAAERLA